MLYAIRVSVFHILVSLVTENKKKKKNENNVTIACM